MSFDQQRMADEFAKENAALDQIRADMTADDSEFYVRLVALVGPVVKLHGFYRACGLDSEKASAHVLNAVLSMCREHEREELP